MHFSIAILLALLMAFTTPMLWAEAASIDVEIQEWQVPWEKSRPRDPSVAANGDIWFVGQGDDYVAKFNPKAEEFERINLPDGTGPHNVIVGPDQGVWVAGNRNARVIKVDPKTHEMKSFGLPDNEGDPHTQQFNTMGILWFTMQHHNAIGRLDPGSGNFKVVPLSTPRARPYGLRIADDDTVWFTEFGSNKMARLNPDTHEIREYPLQRKDARPRRLAIAEDGGIWYVDYAQGYLGRLDPLNGDQQEWPAPSGKNSMPYAMSIDNEQRLWFVETGPSPNNLVAFDPHTGKYVVNTPIKSGGGAVRHMVFDAKRNSLWFGTDTNTLGVARIGNASN